MPEHLRIYLDQCLRVGVAEALRNDGHDVIRSSEVGQARADDFEILQHIISDNRILVTLVDHFGNWVVLPLGQHPGVIRLKINPTTAANAIKLLIPFLKKHKQSDFKDQLVILSPKRSRWIDTGN